MRLTVLGLAAAATVAFTALGSTSAAAAASLPGTVSSGTTKLTVRSAPTAASAPVGSLRNGAKLALVCSVQGPKTKGRVRTTDRWDRLTGGGYVSDAYVTRRKTPGLPGTRGHAHAGRHPDAGHAGDRAADRGRGRRRVGRAGAGQGHQRLPHRVPPHPRRHRHHGHPRDPDPRAAAGTVITVVCNTSGPSCDVDGSPGIKGCGWYVEIHHAGDITTRYCHMVRRPDVVVGQQVTAGRTIGFVGTSGNSSARTCTSRSTSAAPPPASTPSTRSPSCAPPAPPSPEQAALHRMHH